MYLKKAVCYITITGNLENGSMLATTVLRSVRTRCVWARHLFDDPSDGRRVGSVADPATHHRLQLPPDDTQRGGAVELAEEAVTELRCNTQHTDVWAGGQAGRCAGGRVIWRAGGRMGGQSGGDSGITGSALCTRSFS